MKLSFNATIVVDMDDPIKYGYVEPTIKSLVKMVNNKECKLELASDLFIDPVFIFKQTKK